MAIRFDEDVAGAVLEYGVLQRATDAQKRKDWEAANLHSWIGSSPWIGPGMHRHALSDMLGQGRDHQQVKHQLGRSFTLLESRGLIEPLPEDDNLHTQWRVVTPLGQELFQNGTFHEYIFGPAELVKRWKSNVVKVYPRTLGEVNIGTGFLVRQDFVATARHVLDDLKDFEVATQDGAVLDWDEALVLPTPKIDVALIHLTRPVTSVRPMVLSPSVEVLDTVTVMGFPRVGRTDDIYMLANKGKISAIVGRYDGHAATILISCLLRGGYSGGPVMNERGYVTAMMVENLYTPIGPGMADLNAGLGIAAATDVAFVLDLLQGKGDRWSP